MRTLSLLLLACLGAACNTSKEMQRTPKQEEKYAAAVKRKEVLLGMKKSEVRRAWGTPHRTRPSVYKTKPVTVWEYAFAEFYFDRDGYVVGWISGG